jgi:hypothetical protein
MSQEELDKEFKELLATLEEKGYDKMSYSKEGDVTIPGRLFSKFINQVNYSKKVVESFEKSFGIMLKLADEFFLTNGELTLELLKQHIANCDQGKCITSEELDAEDAEDKIKEVVK